VKIKLKQAKLSQKIIALTTIVALLLATVATVHVTFGQPNAASASVSQVIHNFPTNIMPGREYFPVTIPANELNWAINRTPNGFDGAYTAAQSRIWNGAANPRHMVVTRDEIRFFGNRAYASSSLLYSSAYPRLESVSFTFRPERLNFHTMNLGGFLFNGAVTTTGAGAAQRMFYTGYALVFVGVDSGNRNVNSGDLRVIYVENQPLGNPGHWTRLAPTAARRRSFDTFPAQPPGATPAHLRAGGWAVVEQQTIRAGIQGGLRAARQPSFEVNLVQTATGFQLLIDNQLVYDHEYPAGRPQHRGNFGFFAGYNRHRCSALTVLIYENVRITVMDRVLAASVEVNFLCRITGRVLAPQQTVPRNLGDPGVINPGWANDEFMIDAGLVQNIEYIIEGTNGEPDRVVEFELMGHEIRWLTEAQWQSQQVDDLNRLTYRPGRNIINLLYRDPAYAPGKYARVWCGTTGDWITPNWWPIDGERPQGDALHPFTGSEEDAIRVNPGDRMEYMVELNISEFGASDAPIAYDIVFTGEQPAGAPWAYHWNTRARRVDFWGQTTTGVWELRRPLEELGLSNQYFAYDNRVPVPHAPHDPNAPLIGTINAAGNNTSTVATGRVPNVMSQTSHAFNERDHSDWGFSHGSILHAAGADGTNNIASTEGLGHHNGWINQFGQAGHNHYGPTNAAGNTNRSAMRNFYYQVPGLGITNSVAGNAPQNNHILSFFVHRMSGRVQHRHFEHYLWMTAPNIPQGSYEVMINASHDHRLSQDFALGGNIDGGRNADTPNPAPLRRIHAGGLGPVIPLNTDLDLVHLFGGIPSSPNFGGASSAAAIIGAAPGHGQLGAIRAHVMNPSRQQQIMAGYSLTVPSSGAEAAGRHPQRGELGLYGTPDPNFEHLMYTGAARHFEHVLQPFRGGAGSTDNQRWLSWRIQGSTTPALGGGSWWLSNPTAGRNRLDVNHARFARPVPPTAAAGPDQMRNPLFDDAVINLGADNPGVNRIQDWRYTVDEGGEDVVVALARHNIMRPNFPAAAGLAANMLSAFRVYELRFRPELPKSYTITDTIPEGLLLRLPRGANGRVVHGADGWVAPGNWQDTIRLEIENDINHDHFGPNFFQSYAMRVRVHYHEYTGEETIEFHFTGLPQGATRVFFEADVMVEEGLFINQAEKTIYHANFYEIPDVSNQTWHMANMIPVTERYRCYITGEQLQPDTITWVPRLAPRNNYGVPPSRLSNMYQGAETYRFYAWSTSPWLGNCVLCDEVNPAHRHNVVDCGYPADGIRRLRPDFVFPDCPLCDNGDDDTVHEHPDPPDEAWVVEHVLHGVTEYINNSITLYFVRDLRVYIHQRCYYNPNHIFFTWQYRVPGMRPFTLPPQYLNSISAPPIENPGAPPEQWTLRNYNNAWSVGVNNYFALVPTPPDSDDPNVPPTPIFGRDQMQNPTTARHDINLFFVEHPVVTIRFHHMPDEDNPSLNRVIAGVSPWTQAVIPNPGPPTVFGSFNPNAGMPPNQNPVLSRYVTDAAGNRFVLVGYRLSTDAPAAYIREVNGPAEIRSLAAVSANISYTLFFVPAPITDYFINLRQVVLNPRTSPPVPHTGYFRLVSGDALAGNAFPLTAPSATQAVNPPFRNAMLTMASENDLRYWVQATIPQYYEYVGHTITSEVPTAANPHLPSGANFSADAQPFLVDFSDGSQLWVTVYVQPRALQARHHAWETIVNRFGLVNPRAED